MLRTEKQKRKRPHLRRARWRGWRGLTEPGTSSLGPNWHAARLEVLEDRRLLALPAPVRAALDTNLASSILTATAATANLPIIGPATNNPAFIQSQVSSITAQLDAAFDAGSYTVVSPPGMPNIQRTTFTQPAHAVGTQSVKFVDPPGQSFLKLDPIPPNPQNLNPPPLPDPNANAYVTMWVDTYYYLQFDVDTSTGTFTLNDIPLSAASARLASSSTGLGLGHSWQIDVDAPDAPAAVVVLATLGATFEANGKVGGIPVQFLDHTRAAIAAGGPITLTDVTHVLATIDITMGNPSVGIGGSTPATVNARLTGEAHLNLDTRFDVDAGFGLAVTSQIIGTWSFNQLLLTPQAPAQLPDAAHFGDLPYLEFRDVTADLGDTIRTIGTILNDIQSVTDSPVLHDIVTLFDTQIPIIGLTLLDIAETLDSLGPVADVLAILSYINSLHITGQATGGIINTGDFLLSDPRQDQQPVIIATSPSDGAPQEAESFLSEAFGITLPDQPPQYGLRFRFLEDPEHVLFPVLAGENLDLVTFSIPRLHFSFTLDDIFGSFGTYELFTDFPGVSLDGLLEVDLELAGGYDATGLRRAERSKVTDDTDANFGLYLDTSHTRVVVRGGMVLDAGGLGFGAIGGITANVGVTVTGHLDPDDPNRVRGGFLADSVTNLILPHGTISAYAEFDVPGADPEILADQTLADFDIPGFSIEVKVPGEDKTIRIEKSDTNEDIFVIQTHLEVGGETPVYGTPAQYDLAILVIYPEKREFYKIARYELDGTGHYQKAEQYGEVNLIFIGGALTGPDNAEIHKKVYIDALDGSGVGFDEPINVVMLGTNGNDELKYFGLGSAIAIGGGGTDVLRARTVEGLGLKSALVSDYLDPANPLPDLFPLTPDQQAEIEAAGTAPPPPPPPPGGSAAPVASSLAEPAGVVQRLVGSGADDFVVITNGDLLQGFSLHSTIISTGGGTGSPAYIELNNDTLGQQGTITGGSLRIAIPSDLGSPRIVTLTETSLRGWSEQQGLVFEIFLSNLSGTLTLDLAGVDRFAIEGTPDGIGQVIVNNPSFVQESVYFASATADFELNGNFSMYFGQRLHEDGSIERIEHLGSLPIEVAYNANGDQPHSFVFDGDADVGTAEYHIGYQGNYQYINNETVGLTLLRMPHADDDTYVYLPGGSVDADLKFGNSGTYHFDGRSRPSTANPETPNDIGIQVPIGSIALDPVGDHDSLLSAGDLVYVLGSMPQDSFAVSVASSTTVGPHRSTDYSVLAFGVDFSNADAYYSAAVPPDTYPLLGESSFDDQHTIVNELLYTMWPELAVGSLPYSFFSPATDGSLAYNQIYLRPGSNYDPPLPASFDVQARFFETDPVSVDSHALLDASQLRGQLSFTTLDPDYTYAAHLAGFFYSLVQRGYAPSDVSPYFTGFDLDYPVTSVAFGQTYVTLTDASPETTVAINGTDPLAQNASTPFYLGETYTAVQDAATHVTLGASDLSRVQGNVTLSKVELTLDDRVGTAANILQLTDTSFTGWATAAGLTQPTATYSTLYGTLTLLGGANDQFAIGATPAGAVKVVISNVSPGGGEPLAQSMALVDDGSEPQAQSMADESTTPGIYLMAKQPGQDLDVTGNFSLYIGRRLQADGMVENVGDIAGVTNFGGTLATQNIFYNYTGEGLGTLVYDASNFAGTSQNFSIKPDTVDPQKGTLTVDFSTSARNRVVFTPNTELFVYASIRDFGSQGIAAIDNRTTAAVHYIANPLSQPTISDTIRVLAAYGPVDVVGRGAASLVTLVPENNNGDLHDTITADVTVTNAALVILPDQSATPTPAELSNVVLTGTQLTGLTGATVNFADLKDYVSNFLAYPGLHIGMPQSGAASLTINDTPAGVTTGVNTVNGVPIGAVSVLQTTGPLWLGRRNLGGIDVVRNEFRRRVSANWRRHSTGYSRRYLLGLRQQQLFHARRHHVRQSSRRAARGRAGRGYR